MSRFGEYDGDYFPNQSELWWANTERAIKGARGQAALLDLHRALKALPEPVLAGGSLARQGQVCALGALALHRRVQAGEDRETVLAELETLARSITTDYCKCGHPERNHDEAALGCLCRGCISTAYRFEEAGREPPPYFVPCSAYEFEHTEDEDGLGGDTTAQLGVSVGTSYVLAWHLAYLNDETFGSCSPEERHTKMLAWIEERLLPVPV